MSLTITIPGAVVATTGATAPATLTIGVGTPGATGPQGPAGQGVPAGGTAGQFLTKIDGTNYNTDWTTVNLSAYAPLASPAFTGNPTAPTAALADNDTSIATTAFVQQELASGTAIAKSIEVNVRNQTGSTLAAGTIVYINGATGNRPTVTPAQANNDANSAQTFGFVKTSIANNGFGQVIVRGEVENLDTSALTEGQQLYLSPTTAGTWTTTKPYAPDHLVYVGIVVRSHPTQGVILSAIQNGYELNEIHDVAISSVADGDLLSYESSTTLWKNKSISTLGLLTSATAASTYAPLVSASLTGNVTITSNSASPALVITQDGAGDIIQFKDVSSDTTYSFIDQSGKVSTIASTTTNAGLNVPHGTAPTSPVNGDIWTTSAGGLFVRVNAATRSVALLEAASNVFTGASNTFGNSTANGTTSLASGLTTSGFTKNVNVGTGGLAGSTTNIVIGSTTGTSTTTLQGITNGVTQSAGDSSLKLATTAFVTTADNLKANLASPTFTGVPLSTTAAADTNTTQIATTAFVVGQASSSTPAATGTAAIGTSLKYARADHVHANPLPTGGTTGQVLSKVDGTSYNVQWTTPSGGGAVWGSITGTILDQSDLLSTYLPRSGGTITGTIDCINYSGFDSAAFGYTTIQVSNSSTGGYSSMTSSGVVKGGNSSSGLYTQIDAGGVHFPDGSTQTTAGWIYNFTNIIDSLTLGSASSVGGGSPGSGNVLTYNGSGQVYWSAPSSGAPYYNAVWAYGGWYTANTTNIYDSGSGTYYNVLTF